jgi:urease accessory protein
MLFETLAPVDIHTPQPGEGYLRAISTPTRGTVISHARATSPLRIFCPRVWPGTAWVVTATLGGGLVGGDDIQLSVVVEAGASVLLTTQASTKVYRSARLTRQNLTAQVGDEAVLVVLPDPIMGFAGSKFEQRQQYELEARASLLAVDWLVSGRRASGEQWAFDRYASRFQIARAGRPIFYDHLRLSQMEGLVADRMRRFNCYLVAVATGPMLDGLASGILTTVTTQTIDPERDPVVSVNAFNDGGGVIVRMAGASVERVAATLRNVFRPIVSALGDDPWARRW